MSPAIKHFVTDRHGTAAIEFAIAIVPVVILLTGGITYAGVFSMRLALQNAANEAVRFGIGGISLCERKGLAERAARRALSLGDAGDAVVTVDATESRLRVTIAYPYGQDAITPIMMPVPDMLSATAVTLTDEPVMPLSDC